MLAVMREQLLEIGLSTKRILLFEAHISKQDIEIRLLIAIGQQFLQHPDRLFLLTQGRQTGSA